MACNYVVTAHPPTAVSHSLVGRLTGQNDLNLVVALGTRIEIFRLLSEGLSPVCTVNIFGRISTMELLRMPGDREDSVVFTTERRQLCLLGWDGETCEIVTRSNGLISDRVGRPREAGDQLLIVDPQLRFLGLQVYDSMLKLIPVDPVEGLREAFNVRLEEQNVLDLCFLHCCTSPNVMVLHVDVHNRCHLKTYEVCACEKELRPQWGVSHVDSTSHKVIPVPPPCGGVILVAEESITYFLTSDEFKRVPIDPCEIQAFALVDEDGSRILVGDSLGFLYMLIIGQVDGLVTSLEWESLGQTSIPSTLSYLDSGTVYVGSACGDSQLIALTGQRDPGCGNYFSVRETYCNLGPIVDFCVVDVERQGQCQLVTCSGVSKDGSLRQVRNGIGINEIAEIELEGIQNMWALRANYDALYDAYLVQSFVGETRVLTLSAPLTALSSVLDRASDDAEGLEETDIAGFDLRSRTLLCANMIYNTWLQVTSKSVRLVSCETLQCVCKWSPPNGSAIVVATCTASQIIVATQCCRLTCLTIPLDTNESVQLVEGVQLLLEHGVACMCCSQLEVGKIGAKLLCVGMWTETTLRIYKLPSLELAGTELLGGDFIARSVLMVAYDCTTTLFCGLGNGQLLTFSIDTNAASLRERKTVSLGTQPILLRAFRARGNIHVFAGCDRPAVVYSSSGKMNFSNVNLKGVGCVCPFHCVSFPDHMAISTETKLIIGAIDEIQKLHIRTIPLHEQPRRICHLAETRAFGVITVLRCDGPIADDSPFNETYYLRVYDDQTFEEVDSVELKPYETACSVISTSFGIDSGPQFLVVGTALTPPGEAEPTQGRIIVFQLVDRTLLKATEVQAHGAVYAMADFNGRLLAGINSRVQLYNWGDPATHGVGVLVEDCSHHGHILALYIATRGNVVVVGDLMKSISVLSHDPEQGKLDEVARDFDANWMTAVSTIDDNTFIGAEQGLNFFTARRNDDAATTEEKARLDVVGVFHVGDFVNSFRHGSLVMQVPPTDPSAGDATVEPMLLFGTISGMIGAVKSLPAETFLRFEKMQKAMQKSVCGVGGLVHADWRSFHSDKKTQDCRGFVDGDLIESFLDLPKWQMEEVTNMMNTAESARGAAVSFTVEDLQKMVEDANH